jgi:hypothetical protein
LITRSGLFSATPIYIDTFQVTGENSGFAPNVFLDLTLRLPASGDFNVQNFTFQLPQFDITLGKLPRWQVFDNLNIHAPFSAVESMVKGKRAFSHEQLLISDFRVLKRGTLAYILV